MQISVVAINKRGFFGFVGIFTTDGEVIKGIRNYEQCHLVKQNRGPLSKVKPFRNIYGGRTELFCVDGRVLRYVLTRNVVTNQVIGT